MIEVNHLTKRYGDFTAVNDLSFKLAPGEVLGFLGPNGAGKSTTMRMLTGFLYPDAGSAAIRGFDITTHTLEAQRHIGYLPEGAPAYEEMTVQGFLEFIARVRGFCGAAADERVAAAVSAMSLEGVLRQKIETLSKGFKRRVGLAQAILHDPDVLILDEPTDGLDPNQKHQVREMIKGLSRDKIVIVSTHILEEVSAICNRVMVLARGGIVFDGAPDELLRRSAWHGAVTLRLVSGDMDALRRAAEGLGGVQAVQCEQDVITVFPAQPGGGLFGDLARLVREGGYEVSSLHQEQGRLDEVFRALTAGEAH